MPKLILLDSQARILFTSSIQKAGPQNIVKMKKYKKNKEKVQKPIKRHRRKATG
jgi:hypothetical protein